MVGEQVREGRGAAQRGAGLTAPSHDARGGKRAGLQARQHLQLPCFSVRSTIRREARLE